MAIEKRNTMQAGNGTTRYRVYLPRTKEFPLRNGPVWGWFHTRELAEVTLSDVRKNWPEAKLEAHIYEFDENCDRAEEVHLELAEAARIKNMGETAVLREIVGLPV